MQSKPKCIVIVFFLKNVDKKVFYLSQYAPKKSAKTTIFAIFLFVFKKRVNLQSFLLFQLLFLQVSTEDVFLEIPLFLFREEEGREWMNCGLEILSGPWIKVGR